MAGKKGRSGGHNRKSIAEHKLAGTYRKDRHGDVQVSKGDLKKLEVPEYLTDTYSKIDAEEIFNYFSELLFKQGMTSDEDIILLTQLVDAEMLYRTYRQYALTDPEAVIGRRLAVTCANEQAKIVRELMAEYRLTPTTRTSAGQGEGEKVDADPMGAFLKAV
jgi:hypothetical protein